jgi:hypothetical protein
MDGLTSQTLQKHDVTELCFRFCFLFTEIQKVGQNKRKIKICRILLSLDIPQTRRSQASANSKPPPRAAPSTTAMVGIDKLCKKILDF